MASISISKVNKYFGNTHVIKDVSLDIKSKSFTVIVGPSGCGKSTILRMIAGLENIDNGSITIDNKVVNELDPKDRNIAMVFQSYALYPHMNVFDNMAFGLKIEKKTKEEINERVTNAAKILKIENLLERKPKQLSGGQRQRVAIGRAITRNPKVFLFDEPLSNLDAALRVEMRVELAKIHNKLDATMVYVTHDQTEAMTLADNIIVLDEGVISQNGTPLELYKKPKNLFVAGFIGSPKMNFINSKVLSKDESKIEISILGSNITFPRKINTYDENDIIFGIRPEDITITDGSDYDFQGKAYVVEKLGSNTFIYLDNEGDPIVIETSGDSAIKVGDGVKIKFDLNKTNLFNSKNNFRID